MTSQLSAADAIATGSQIIEIRVAELRQLFNAINPSPFRERGWSPVRRSSLSNGRAICLATPHWPCVFTSNVPPGAMSMDRCTDMYEREEWSV